MLEGEIHRGTRRPLAGEGERGQAIVHHLLVGLCGGAVVLDER